MPQLGESVGEAGGSPALSAQTLAGRAILLEIGAKLGILDPLLSQADVSVAETAQSAGMAEPLVGAYYTALASAGLVKPSANGHAGTHFSALPELHRSINDCGYVLWGAISCGPLLLHAKSFFSDLNSSIDLYPRDGEHVARTSRWMGERDFYPHAEKAILGAKPKKIVDLGSGTCGLLMRMLRQLPEATGVGIDINAAACANAKELVQKAGMAERIEVLHRPIQALIDDPSPLEGAEVIHGGFVFHDLMPDEEATLDGLLRTFRKHAPNGAVLVVDAVPYAQNPGEEAFSAAFTFLHSHFMGRKLQTEEEWTGRLRAAGYGNVTVDRLGIPGGRIFTGRA